MFYKQLFFDDCDQITSKLQNTFFELNQTDFKQYNQPYLVIKNVCPELDNQFKNYNLNVIGAYLFQTQPASLWLDSGTIHVDLDKHTKPNLVLNWPIFNCENTYMNFWQVRQDIQGSPAYTTRLQQEYATFNKGDCTFLDQLELISPHLIDVSTPHNVSTKNENYRLIISFRFSNNPLHLWC
jgi:hypothetical protein